MVQLFGITPAWGLPCVSPFVTKVAYALQLKGVEFTLERQNLATAATDSPIGKLPYVVLADGARMADSSAIVEKLAPDRHLSGQELALSTAIERMLDEHTYWHVAVEPRWLSDESWQTYRCTLFGVDQVPSEMEAPMEQVRQMILGQWVGCGIGRLSASRRAERAIEDVRSLSSLLQPGAFAFGEWPSNIDGAIAATTAHMLHAPYPSAAAVEAKKHPVLASHLDLVLRRIGASIP